ncbi:hypothetical protein [Flavonifractor sp. An4]|uniref:hypothetical protein n=1 Tax=Flavonifractor sp. An4 TaxID=1965634 RepID=UPI000B36AAD5|nr:hypothetical protein [Flavonifractor sp. An4]OUO09182.1 hypothetical protein B5F94_15115 [Flavonifractor sp. An4]
MWTDYIVPFIMFFVGIFVYSIGVMQIILVLSCAIPLTKRMAQIYIVDTKGAYKQSAMTIVIWTVVTAAVVAAVLYFCGKPAKISFFIGAGLSFLISLGKWGMSKSNVADYFQAYAKFYPKKALDDIFGTR